MQDDLREMEVSITYPANQRYDPVTLQPVGVTKDRVELMSSTVPELLRGGGSLLDVGSSKGFVCFWLRDRYSRIVGYEISREAHEIAASVRRYHDLGHVQLVNRSFRDIPFSRFRLECFDVVYAGSVIHHFFRDAVRHGAPPWLSLAKLSGLCKRHLIIEAPLQFSIDYSLTMWEREYRWPAEVREAYSVDAICDMLAPEFELTRGPTPNERNRYSLVFTRQNPSLACRELSPDQITEIKQRGEVITCNPERHKDAVIRDGDACYKLCGNPHQGSMYLVMNKLPALFPHTHFLVTHNGRNIGTCAEWIDGEPISDAADVWLPWLRLNNILSVLGVIEPHFKICDFIRKNGEVYDIDVDMVQDTRFISRSYLQKLQERFSFALDSRWGEYKTKVEYLLANFYDEWVFQELMES